MFSATEAEKRSDLHHDPDLPAQALQIDLAHVLPVDAHDAPEVTS